MPVININQHNLYYEISGQCVPVLLISGLGHDHRAWEPVKKVLEKNFQVITYDHHGCGQSDQLDGKHSIKMLSDDAAALLEALELKEVNVVGQSMGGLVAQQLVFDFPEKINKIVLLNSFSKFSFVSQLAISNIIEMQKQGIDTDTLLNTIIAWTVSSEYLEKENNYQKKIESMRANPYPQAFDSFVGHVDALFNFDSTNRLIEIKKEVLVITAQNDLLVTVDEARKFAEGILGAEFVVIPGGHESHTEQSGLLGKNIGLFFEEE